MNIKFHLHRRVWTTAFFLGVPLLLFISFFTLSFLQPVQSTSSPKILSVSDERELPFVPTFSPSFIVSDARPIIIRNYLHEYSSPLEPQARLLVQISDKYSLDYRLLVAIAQQESNLCKKIPKNSFNCWGFGIYGNQVLKFDNYPQAIETVAQSLKKNYIDQGLTTPEKIMAKYTPPSLEVGGAWAKGVSSFLLDME